MTDDKLRERLLALESGSSDFIGDKEPICQTCWHRNPDGPAAVAELDRLAAELTRKSAIADQLAEALEPFARIAQPKTDEPGAYTPLECIDTLYDGTGELRLSSLVGSTDSYETMWAADFIRAAEVLAAPRASNPDPTVKGEKNVII